MLGIPVVDVHYHYRGHPTGIMGSMWWQRDKKYLAIQAAVRGSREKSTFLEVAAMGSIEKASTIVRNVAVRAGGLVAVERNPVTTHYTS